MALKSCQCLALVDKISQDDQQEANAQTLLAVEECSRTRNLQGGRQVHAEAVKCGHDSHIYVASALIKMYAKCGSMVDACQVFDAIKHPTLISWNVLILGYTENGQGLTALEMFTKMRSAPNSVTIMAALKACTSVAVKEGPSCWPECREKGKGIHNLAAENGCESVYVGNSLVVLYAKCGSVVGAREVFDGIKQPSVVSWNVLISAYVANGQCHTALDMFSRMRSEGPAHNSVTLLAALKACTSLAVKEHSQLHRGKGIHSIALEDCCISGVNVQSTMLNMYAKCGSMADARDVFDGMKHRDVVSWTALILGYVTNGQGNIALDLFSKTRSEGLASDSVILVAALKACISLAVTDGTECRERGKQIHNFSVENGCNSDLYVQSTLLDMYAKCHSIVDARNVFDSMKHATVVSWTSLILGYADNGQGSTALDMFTRMRSEGPPPNSVTFVAALKACTSLAVAEGAGSECKERGKELHNVSVESECSSDTYVQCTLVDMYAKCGSMVDARDAFDCIKNPTVASWTALISGYAENGQGITALEFFIKMRMEGAALNSVTLVAALKACTSIAVKGGDIQRMECRDRGKLMHNMALENGCNSEVYVQNSIVDLYAKCGSMLNAREVFDGMKQRDIVSWNILILGYVENCQGQIALDMFTRMRTLGYAPDCLTMVAALKACNTLTVKKESGNMIQNIAVENGCSSDAYVQSTLVDMYRKCCSMVDAREVFNGMKHPDIVSWNVIILGYVDNGQSHTALDLFARMRSEGYTPNSVTFGAALKACGMLGALEFGRTIHSVIGRENELGVELVTCLVDFYAKCGSLVEAQKVFDFHDEARDIISWNALLAGFSSYGDIEVMFGLFEGMQDAGFKPDGITFLCILTCCSHAGLVVKGKEYFDGMPIKYGIIPTIKHYTCMIDLFGRANKIEDSMALLERMPCSPDGVTWMTILGACRKWKNVEIGRVAFQSLIDLESKDVAAYVLMGQIYGSRGMMKEQEVVMGLRKNLKASEKPGKTCWTSEAGNVHTFSSENSRHPQIDEIRDKWKSMSEVLRQHGYTNIISRETKKEEALCSHSERLALVCALINTQDGKTVRIVKNVRVCEDCHLVIGLISKLKCRTIICRDESRLHVFKDGKCSCGDSW